MTTHPLLLLLRGSSSNSQPQCAPESPVHPRQEGHFSNNYLDESVSEYHSAGSLITQEGDVPVDVFVILSGQVELSKTDRFGDDVSLGTLGPGDVFGEIGLLEGSNRIASARARGQVKLQRCNFDTLQRVFAMYTDVELETRRTARCRFLRSIILFRNLDDHALGEVADSFEVKRYDDKAVLYYQQDFPESLFIVLRGRVKISGFSRKGKEIQVAFLEQGSFFGLKDLFISNSRKNKAEAMEGSTLLVLHHKKFEVLLREHPTIAFDIIRMLSRRLADKDNRLITDHGPFSRGLTIINRPERCLSCKSCEIACAVAKSRSESLFEAIHEQPAPIRRLHVRRTLDGSQPTIVPEHCSNCRDTPCLTSCQRGAIKREPNSRLVSIIESRCVGCGKCVKACPSNVVHLIQSEQKKKVALKCTLCTEHPDGPACVRACPTNSLLISLPSIAPIIQ